MEFIKHSSCNAQLGPPPGVSDRDCGTLPIKRWRMPGWGPVETSFWKPSEAELAALNAGGSIAVNLHVGPGQHPMMSTQVYEADDKPAPANAEGIWSTDGKADYRPDPGQGAPKPPGHNPVG